MRMEPEAIQRWGDANRAYLALVNEVAVIFAAEAGEAEGTVETRWEHPMLTVRGDVNRVTRDRMKEAWLAWECFGQMNGAPDFESMIDGRESSAAHRYKGFSLSHRL